MGPTNSRGKLFPMSIHDKLDKVMTCAAIAFGSSNFLGPKYLGPLSADMIAKKSGTQRNCRKMEFDESATSWGQHRMPATVGNEKRIDGAFDEKHWHAVESN